MNFIKCFFLGGILSCLAVQSVKAQLTTGQLSGGDTLNVITTAVPILRIGIDARSGGMAEAGLAISPDANSVYWNASKLVFIDKKAGASVNFTPWLKNLVDDIYLANLSGYTKIGKNQAIAMSFTYFSLGNIVFTDIVGEQTGQYRPNELYITGSYARALSKNFSTALSLKYIRSDLAKGQVSSSSGLIKVGHGAAADISMFYKKKLEISNKEAEYALGIALTNIGSKISYTDNNDTRDFMPANIGIGNAFSLMPNEHHKITATLDINKLMVPTPIGDLDNNNVDDSREKPEISGIISSFGDAPQGFKEELRELMYSFGAEYWYDNQFAVRAGYYNEHKTKGNRKYVSFGFGAKLKIFQFNLSYLVPTNNQNSPLQNTWRISFLFDFNNNNSASTKK